VLWALCAVLAGLIVLGVLYTIVPAVTRPGVLARAPALLEGDESLETDPVPPGA
jgi:hypothetical protein